MALPYLRARLKPAPAVDRERVRRLIADLDSDEFATRDNAGQELEKLGDSALGPCEAALAAKPSLEARRRLEAITGRLRGLWDKPDPERLRTLRALEALELCGTAEAREVLSSLAKGADGAPVTERAKAALGRIGEGS